MAGFIYFIGDDPVCPSAVKIGFTRRTPARRMSYLQTGNPNRLYLLASAPGTFDRERHLHRVLKCDRISGDWFRFSKEVSFEIEIAKAGVE